MGWTLTSIFTPPFIDDDGHRIRIEQVNVDPLVRVSVVLVAHHPVADEAEVDILSIVCHLLNTEVNIIKTKVNILTTEESSVRTEVNTLKTKMSILKAEVNILKRGRGIFSQNKSEYSFRCSSPSQNTLD